jgi:hypothetical protein
MLDTLYEIDSEVLRYIGEEPTDDDVRAEWAPLLLNVHSRTNVQICNEKIHPKACDPVVLGADKTFKAVKDTDDENALDHKCNGEPIIALQYPDWSEDAGWDKSIEYTIRRVAPKLYVVPGAADGDTVYVLFEYVPDAFTKNTYTGETDDTDEPELVEEANRMAFVYNGAAAIFLSKKQLNSMAAFQTLAEDEIAKIREVGAQKRVKGTLFRRRSRKRLPVVSISGDEE